jgi:cytochrome c oxidase subunit 4
MTTETSDSRAEHEATEHIRSSRYWIIWVALLVGTLATYGAYHIHVPEPFHILVALLIACVKSALVVLFFMHLWDHGGASRIVFVTSIFFVALLIGLVVLDNATRYSLLNPGRGTTLQHEPPGPDILTPRVYPPEPGRREDMPSAVEPGRNVSVPEEKKH